MGKYGLIGEYYYRKGATGSFSDFSTTAGVRVLAIDGINERGETVNVYTAQWIESEIEDYICTKKETVEVGGVTTTRDVIIRKNVDINLTMIISRRYATIEDEVDEQATYDTMISTLCESGDIYLKSLYLNKIVHVVCLKAVKPTAVKLHRGRDSYILVTIPFHVLEPPTSAT